MTDPETNERIAVFCGWRRDGNWVITPAGDRLHALDGAESMIPDYCSDLNAIAEAEAKLTDEQWIRYEQALRKTTMDDCPDGKGLYYRLIHATARQRAQALLKAI